MAHELFEIQTKIRIDNSLQVIDFLLDHNPTPEGRDSLIHEQVRLIRELVGLTRYVRPPTRELVYGTQFRLHPTQTEQKQLG